MMLHVVVFGGGAALVAWTLFGAVRTFVVPRSDNVWLTRAVFLALFQLFRLRLWRTRSYRETDRVLAFFAPVGLVLLPVVWVTLVLIGFMLMFWAAGVQPWIAAFLLSGSSLLTLGFAPVAGVVQISLAFVEATLGLGLIALLIAYLPTIYAAFSKRETAVTLLETWAGTPPTAVTMIERAQRIRGLEQIKHEWPKWELWFGEIRESHTSFGALSLFRSQHPERSWITAAGAVLDAASLMASTVDLPRDAGTELCIRAGYLALREIADFFRISHPTDPHFPDHAISVTRAEYELACEQLAAAGVPLKPDRDATWTAFAGWRVNYDTVLVRLARLIVAPPASWTGDRTMQITSRLRLK